MYYENHSTTHVQVKSVACLKCPRNSVTNEIRLGISRKYMAVFWKGIMTKRTLLRKRWFELSRGFPMLFCAKCERNLNRKNKGTTYRSLTWTYKFHKKLPDMIICLKAAFSIKYWPSSFAIVSSMKSQFVSP